MIRQALFTNLKRILASTLQKQRSRTVSDADQNSRTLRNCLEVYNIIEGWREAEQVVKHLVSDAIRSVSQFDPAISVDPADLRNFLIACHGPVSNNGPFTSDSQHSLWFERRKSHLSRPDGTAHTNDYD